MKKSLPFIFLSIFFFGKISAQTFEAGSGYLFYSASGNILVGDAGSGYKSVAVNEKTVSMLGATFNYYQPVIAKSSEFSLGILTGVSGFLKLGSQTHDYAPDKLYGYSQLAHDETTSKGVQVPLLLNFRLGRNATSNSNSKLGIAVGGGITMSGFVYDNYYYDKFLYFPPTLNGDLSLGRVRLRFMYFLVPYKTYYVYDSGQKETKYNISQYSITLNVTFGDD